VNDHFELNSDIDTYFDHGLRKGSYGDGISALHFGAKYAWLEWLKPTWDTSVGFNSSIPVSRPPIELTDGHDHFVPYIVFGRKLDDVPGLSGLFNVHADFITASSTPGGFGKNEPHSNSLSVTPGVLYDRDAWHYTLEVDAPRRDSSGAAATISSPFAPAWSGISRKHSSSMPAGAGSPDST